MPIWRYFLTVGTALWSVFYLVDVYSDKPSAEIKPDIQRMSIRISSINRSPELVVIDTTLPTITPPPPEYRTVAEIPYRTSLAVIAPKLVDVPRTKRKKILRRIMPQQVSAIPFGSTLNTPW